MSDLASTDMEQRKRSDSLDLTSGAESASVSSGSNTSAGSSDDFFFGKFCRHVPRVLRHQIISKLVNQYIYKMKKEDEVDHGVNRTVSKQGDPGVDFKANTSIYRFHGALLFVDISGFTVLSQKLKVDELKNQINAYFQKIVDIIDKYGGEIIKFAGDALFIIWQTKVSDTSDPNFMDAAKDAADKAVTCGVEINLECSNYPILLKDGSGDSSKVKAMVQSIERTGEFYDLRAPAARPKSRSSSKPGSPRGHSKKRRTEPLVTYLNVHAGVSMGVMAGMDVGAVDRFEYLLLGQPMSDVAVAEGDAQKGEIVISPAVHDLLHHYTSARDSPRKPTNSTTNSSSDMQGISEQPAGPQGSPHSTTSSPSKRRLNCGCERTPSGYYKINNSLDEMVCNVDFGAPQPKSAVPGTSLSEETDSDNADLMYEIEVYNQIVEELMAGFKAVTPHLLEKFSTILNRLSLNGESETKGDVADEFSESGASLSTKRGTTTTVASSSNNNAVEYTEREVMMEHFFSWAQHCLLDDVARHVHEVVRRGFSFYRENRAAPFERFLDDPACIDTFRTQLDRARGHRHSRAGGGGSHHSSHSSNTSGSVSTNASTINPHHHRHSGSTNTRASTDSSFVTKMRQITGLSTQRERKQAKHQQVLSKDGALVSELRNVIVLFISVKTGAAALLVDPKHPTTGGAAAGTPRLSEVKMVQTCKVESFHFLARTEEEIEADKRLINQFQSCMEVMAEVFHAKGGQLRQFIVDDKGTVCIGTFGLRGSVNYDNAAAAVDAADLIVARLQSLGFNASVGVTSGAAYCGLVGSSTRHEYAVMGPSTNLSARLMGRAAEGEILCDSAIRQRDRVHVYASLGAVKAKGYANPVPIFRPRFGIEANSTATTRVDAALALQAPMQQNMDVTPTLGAVFGRKKEAQEVFSFFFHSAVKGSMETLSDAFWIPQVTESEDIFALHAVPLEGYSFEATALNSSKKRRLRMQFAPKNGRFDITFRAKKLVVISPNGMGKTAFLNLFQFKLNALIQKNPEVYNVAVFRHQVGFINATTVFSAWFCLVRQVLLSIAEAVAQEMGQDPAATERVEALKADNFRPIVDFLGQFLPAELVPYIGVLEQVGLNLSAPPASEAAAAMAPAAHAPAASDEQPESKDGFAAVREDTELEPAGSESPPASGKSDPIAALDPSERLQKCADVIVAVVQLHVQITRKVTVFIMDDLQHHDPLSQKLGGLISRTTTGVCLLCTFRTSASYSALRSSVLEIERTTVAEAGSGSGGGSLNSGVLSMSYETAMQSLPLSAIFHRLELPPLSHAAGRKLLAKIFADAGLMEVDNAVLDKLHSLSAGSPLYAAELAKSICDRYVHREDHKELSGAACSVQLSSIIDGMRTDRIEEVVHFRFDKLTEQCQLVLKMAAVAAVNGSHFTLPMLKYILDSSDQGQSSKMQQAIADTKALLGYLSDPDEAGESNAQLQSGAVTSTMDLVQALNDLLESDEFIEYRGDLPVPTGLTSTAEGAVSSYQALQLLATMPTPVTPMPDLNALLSEDAQARSDSRALAPLQQLRFYWKVDMELRAIYDLMLDEQKESLHDRVASYLEYEQQRSSGTTSATEWCEQGFHWERSTAWSSAMTCYYQAGMVLKDIGDSAGHRTHLTAAFRMLDKMRIDAGIPFMDHNHAPAASASAVTVNSDNEQAMVPLNLPVCARPTGISRQPVTEMDIKQAALRGIEYLVCGRNAGFTVDQVYSMFERSSELLYLGLSVLTRLAQSLIPTGAHELALRIFEDCIDIVHIVKKNEQPLTDLDGGEFGLRKKDVCFLMLSGMFLLLLRDGPAQDLPRQHKMVAVVSLSVELARAMPDAEVHLLFAYINKLILMDYFLMHEPSVAAHITTYSEEVLAMYNREKHSQQIVYFYNSDRVCSGLMVAVRLYCMQGRFTVAQQLLEKVRALVSKLKHAFSFAMALAVMFSVQLVYFPNSQAQLQYDNFMLQKAKYGNYDFFEFAPMMADTMAQHLRLAQYRVCLDDSVFDNDSPVMEKVLYTGLLLQHDRVKGALNRMRIYSSAMEYVAARLCLYKALRYELLHQQHASPVHVAQMKHYLELGLLHLTFVPEQVERNAAFLFTTVHEKLLRVHLLIKVLTHHAAFEALSTAEVNAAWPTGEVNEALVASAQATIAASYAELWEHAVSEARFVGELAKRGDMHGLLLQVGAHLQSLGALARGSAAVAAEGESILQEGTEISAAALTAVQELNTDGVDVSELLANVLVR